MYIHILLFKHRFLPCLNYAVALLLGETRHPRVAQHLQAGLEDIMCIYIYIYTYT